MPDLLKALKKSNMTNNIIASVEGQDVTTIHIVIYYVPTENDNLLYLEMVFVVIILAVLVGGMFIDFQMNEQVKVEEELVSS